MSRISIQKAVSIARRAIHKTNGRNDKIKKEDKMSDLGIGDSYAIKDLKQNTVKIALKSQAKIRGSDLNISGGTTFVLFYRRIKEKAKPIPQ